MDKINQPRFLKIRGGPYFEVWYFKLNWGRGKPAFWARLTLLSTPKGMKAETWAIFFDPSPSGTLHAAAKQTYPYSAFEPELNAVNIGPCRWATNSTHGRVQNSKALIEWDLFFESASAPFTHTPLAFRALGLTKAQATTPHPNLTFTGQVSVNGEKFECAAAPGTQGHLFGVKNAHSWAWAHANMADDGTPFVFEALTARVQLPGGKLSPPLSVFLLEFDGKRYELNSLMSLARSHSRYSLEMWTFTAEGAGVKIEGAIRSRPGDFAGVRYEHTDGSEFFCHNSKISDLTLTITEKGGNKKVIDCSGTCAFEAVGPERDPRVPVIL